MTGVPCSPPASAACGCHLDPSQLGPTSSHLLLPEHPTSSRLRPPWSLLTSHLPFAATVFLFAFQVPQLRPPLPWVWRTSSARTPLSTWRCWPFAALPSHPLHPTSLWEGDYPHSRATASSQSKSWGTQDGCFGGSHPSCAQLPAPGACPHGNRHSKTRHRPNLPLQPSTVTAAPAPGGRRGSRRGFGGRPVLGTSLPSLCSPPGKRHSANISRVL